MAELQEVLKDFIDILDLRQAYVWNADSANKPLAFPRNPRAETLLRRKLLGDLLPYPTMFNCIWIAEGEDRGCFFFIA